MDTQGNVVLDAAAFSTFTTYLIDTVILTYYIPCVPKKPLGVVE